MLPREPARCPSDDFLETRLLEIDGPGCVDAGSPALRPSPRAQPYSHHLSGVRSSLQSCCATLYVPLFSFLLSPLASPEKQGEIISLTFCWRDWGSAVNSLQVGGGATVSLWKAARGITSSLIPSCTVPGARDLATAAPTCPPLLLGCQ